MGRRRTIRCHDNADPSAGCPAGGTPALPEHLAAGDPAAWQLAAVLARQFHGDGGAGPHRRRALAVHGRRQACPGHSRRQSRKAGCHRGLSACDAADRAAGHGHTVVLRPAGRRHGAGGGISFTSGAGRQSPPVHSDELRQRIRAKCRWRIPRGAALHGNHRRLGQRRRHAGGCGRARRFADRAYLDSGAGQATVAGGAARVRGMGPRTLVDPGARRREHAGRRSAEAARGVRRARCARRQQRGSRQCDQGTAGPGARDRSRPVRRLRERRGLRGRPGARAVHQLPGAAVTRAVDQAFSRLEGDAGLLPWRRRGGVSARRCTRCAHQP